MGQTAMPRRALLTADQRARLFAIPVDPAEMARHYLFDKSDLARIRSKRRAVNHVNTRGTRIPPRKRPNTLRS